MDEMERRIRSARPLSGHRSLPLSDRAKRELAELILSGMPSKGSRRRPRIRRRMFVLATTVVTALSLVFGTAVVNSVLHPEHAYAVTPDLLVTTPVQGSTHETLSRIAAVVRSETPLTPHNYFTLNVQAWTLQIEDDGKAISSFIAPENYEITRAADGTYTKRVTSAGPYTSAGKPIVGGTGPVEGSLLWEQTWPPEESPFLYPSPAPVVSDEYAAYFGAVIGSGPSVSAAAVVRELNNLLLEQELTSMQRAALLDYLAGLPDLKTVGAVTDRDGRDGIEFSAADPQRLEYELHLIVSPSTGKILATETVYVGHTRTDIASPSVVNYYIWK